MSLYLGNSTVLSTDQTSGSLTEPGGAVDGELQFIIQTADIGGMDAPAGWQVALDLSSSVNLSVWWGIRGIDFAGGSEALSGNSLSRPCILRRFRVTGPSVGPACQLIADSSTFVDGDPASGYFTAPSIDLSPYPNRARLLGTFAGQEVSGVPWDSFVGSGPMPDSFFANTVEVSAGSVNLGCQFYEDNAGSQPSVGQNRFYTVQPAQAGWRVSTCNFAIIGQVPQQTDILAPALVF